MYFYVFGVNMNAVGINERTRSETRNNKRQKNIHLCTGIIGKLPCRANALMVFFKTSYTKKKNIRSISFIDMILQQIGYFIIIF